MKITSMITHIIARAASLVVVFALFAIPSAALFAQSYDYDYDYGDYYSYDYGDYDYNYDYDYDYGDYYSYEYPDYSYDYDYDYDYGDYYSYDYGDYDYNYDYDYDYGDYYSYEYPDYSYDYDYDYDYGDYYSYEYPDYSYDYDYDYGDYYDYDWEDPIYEPPIYEPPTWDWETPYYPPYLPCVDGACEYNYNWEYDYDYNYDYNYDWNYDWDWDWDYPPYEPPCSGSCGESPRPVCTLDATRSSINAGDDFRLEWTTRNATFVTITTLGPVDLDGSALLSPVKSMRYTLSATGPGGSVTCTENITVREEEDDDENVRCDAFTASDTRVERGDSVTLRWNTTGADSVRIDQGVGSVSDDGSERVRVNRDTTYTLTARNGSDEDTCRVTVRVEEEEDDETAPRCRLTISDTQITSGQSVTVSWDNLRTDRAILRDNHGNTIADSRDRNSINEDRDSRVFRPTRSTDYTLTVYKGNTTRTCTVGTELTGGVTLTGTRGQDGIMLSQVPYTGFEAGPVLTFIFYSAIGLWGVVVAYALVMKKVAVASVVAGAAHAPIVSVAGAAMASHATVPNLPVFEEETVAPVASVTDVLATLETRAHAQQALISGDALAHLVTVYGGDAEDALDRVIAASRAAFPTEDGWTVLNKDRVLAILG